MDRRQEDVEALRLARRRRRQHALAGVLLALAGGLGALGISSLQSSAKQGIVSRWDARAAQSASFVQVYAEQLFEREDAVARTDLAGPTPNIETVSEAFGFSNAVLLDNGGRLIAVYPAAPAKLGQRIAPAYPHLVAAETGVRSVSPVVPAAATGAPVVGFAIPFLTLDGIRVFSGAYAVQRTPLTAYLERMTPLKGAGIYLVDNHGTVVTASVPVRGVQTLKQLDPELADALATRPSGYFAAHDVEQYFVAQPVKGTPWTLVARAPTEALFLSVGGRSHALPWILLAVLVVVAAAAVVLWFRRIDDHADLRLAYARLDRLASQDALTGLLNRRATWDALDQLHGQAVAEQSWLSVLMVDVDHFKQINDTFGHAAGDLALCAVANRLAAALREHDVVGRWGGEEFLVVLPGAGPELAHEIAERLRCVVAGTPVAVGSGGDEIGISVSIGVASSAVASPDVLMHVADRALYVAKDTGRDRVHALTP